MADPVGDSFGKWFNDFRLALGLCSPLVGIFDPSLLAWCFNLGVRRMSENQSITLDSGSFGSGVDEERS